MVIQGEMSKFKTIKISDIGEECYRSLKMARVLDGFHKMLRLRSKEPIICEVAFCYLFHLLGVCLPTQLTSRITLFQKL